MGLLAVGFVVVLGLLGMLGPRFRTVAASSNGTSVEVTYASVTRPGLATTWLVEVRRPGGFAGPITIATTTTYFDGFDFNALYPDPDRTSSRGDLVAFTFEPPRGEVFRVRFDGRATPTWTLWRTATTIVTGEGLGETSVVYRTVFLP